MQETALRELYIDELKDLYDAENQLIKALPKMAKAATSQDLRSGFEHHLEQTKGHAKRLEEVFKRSGEKGTGKKCSGMEVLVGEGKDVMDQDFDADVMDAALISVAQRVEHYEIAAYGTVRTFAGILGENEAVQLLNETLQEEKETDEKLTALAANINIRAASEPGPEGGYEDEGEQRNRKPKSRAARG